MRSTRTRLATRALLLLVTGLVVLAPSACGGTSGDEQTDDAAALTERVKDLEQQLADRSTSTTLTTVPPTAPPTTVPPATAPSTTSPPTTMPPTTAGSALMPDVVCMNLQEAQDTIQQTGVFLSRSFDATGAGRMQVLDSNWVVVSQAPEPGAPITEGSANLGVVKIGEPSPC